MTITEQDKHIQELKYRMQVQKARILQLEESSARLLEQIDCLSFRACVCVPKTKVRARLSPKTKENINT